MTGNGLSSLNRDKRSSPKKDFRQESWQANGLHHVGTTSFP